MKISGITSLNTPPTGEITVDHCKTCESINDVSFYLKDTNTHFNSSVDSSIASVYGCPIARRWSYDLVRYNYVDQKKWPDPICSNTGYTPISGICVSDTSMDLDSIVLEISGNTPCPPIKTDYIHTVNYTAFLKLYSDTKINPIVTLQKELGNYNFMPLASSTHCCPSSVFSLTISGTAPCSDFTNLNGAWTVSQTSNNKCDWTNNQVSFTDISTLAYTRYKCGTGPFPSSPANAYNPADTRHLANSYTVTFYSPNCPYGVRTFSYPDYKSVVSEVVIGHEKTCTTLTIEHAVGGIFDFCTPNVAGTGIFCNTPLGCGPTIVYTQIVCSSGVLISTSTLNLAVVSFNFTLDQCCNIINRVHTGFVPLTINCVSGVSVVL